MMNKEFFVALFVALFRFSASESKRYTAKIDLDDDTLHETLLTEYDAHSLVMCSAMCGPRCTYFGYNLQTKKCRVYTGCHSTRSAGPEVGWRYYFTESEENTRPTDCKRLLADGFTLSGVYTIYPWDNPSLEVFCDMDTEDGGWTVSVIRDSMLDTGNPIDLDLSGMNFSTPDRDNDRWSNGSCAAYNNRRGGWWFNWCGFAFLNGPWSPAYWYKPWWPTLNDGSQITET
ncbi:techylectin-5B-like, partial [Saccostrea cucullata]|uniref:techylectin-5B-like n=1 Tax=Saccostrea cuccullata TaxID=36930 RepID=UPI002ED64CCF